MVSQKLVVPIPSYLTRLSAQIVAQEIIKLQLP